MADKTAHPETVQRPFFVSIGMILAIGYWILEAYFDSVLIEDASFRMRLFPQDPNEIWMRSLVSVLFIGFGLYAQFTHVRFRAAKRLNVDAAQLLKNALSKTIRGSFPICANCKNICDENNQWVAPDKFISDHTEAEFLRIVCDKCQIDNRRSGS